VSYTAIYKLGDDEQELANLKNSHRGAMYIWNDFAIRYFGLDRFPMFDMDEANEIWNAQSIKDIPEHEAIVMRTTMDKATVDSQGVGAVIAALKQYGEEHPTSNFSEQAQIIEDAAISGDSYIAWHQTSTSEFWGEGSVYDDDEDDYVYTLYNPNTDEGNHFDVIKNED